jgi:aryl-alcohol dehydrogenase-like predicted oxidoreductase
VELTMEKRRFGRIGHMSSIAIFGSAAFWDIPQSAADETMERVIAAGINHIDVAPSYGEAEARLGPWMARERGRFFLGCKTMERTRTGAEAEMQASMERLNVDHFELYQLHAVRSIDELDEATQTGGALDALRSARERGLTRYIGITGHGRHAPAVFIEALARFDFDSVLFPLNFVQFAEDEFRASAEELIRLCNQRDVGIMAIKSIAKGPWGGREQTHQTWYEPMTDKQIIQNAVNFALSYEVTGLCTPGDVTLLPEFIQSCQDYRRLDDKEHRDLMRQGTTYEPLFA